MFVKKNGFWGTENCNFSWCAGGKGVCAYGYMNIDFEKENNTLKIVGYQVLTVSATGYRMDYAHFSDEQEYFEKIFSKLQGEYIPVCSSDKEIDEELQKILIHGKKEIER